jgi:hypothetical protein
MVKGMKYQFVINERNEDMQKQVNKINKYNENTKKQLNELKETQTSG